MMSNAGESLKDNKLWATQDYGIDRSELENNMLLYFLKIFSYFYWKR